MAYFYVNFRQQHLKIQSIKWIQVQRSLAGGLRSKIAKSLDNESVLERNIQASDILQLVDEEYGATDYGSIKL